MPRPSPTSIGQSLPRGLMVLVGLAAAFLVISGLRSASGIIGPIFLALVLTIMVQPVSPMASSRGLPSWLTSLICIVVVYALLIGLSVALVVATARFATLLPTYKEQFADLLNGIGDWLAGLGVGQKEINDLVDAVDPGQLAAVFAGFLGGLLGVLSDLVFILTLVFFLTVDAGSFANQLASTGETRARLVGALLDFGVGTRTYLLVSTVFGLIVAVFDGGPCGCSASRCRCYGGCCRSSPTTSPTSAS